MFLIFLVSRISFLWTLASKIFYAYAKILINVLMNQLLMHHQNNTLTYKKKKIEKIEITFNCNTFLFNITTILLI